MFARPCRVRWRIATAGGGVASTTVRILMAAFLVAGCATFPAGPRGDGSVLRGRGPAEGAAPPAFNTADWLNDVVLDPKSEPLPPESEAELVLALAALRSPSFETYSGAARKLVQMGAVAVPYLGHAADREASALARERIVIVLRSIAETLAADAMRTALDSAYASVRAAAAEACGKGRLTEHAPRLVDLLEDENRPVRQAAVSALRRISTSFFGYRADRSAKRRAPAVAKWRALWGPSR